MCCFLLSPGTTRGRDGCRLTGGPNALHPNHPAGPTPAGPPHALDRVEGEWAVPRPLPHLPEEQLTECGMTAPEDPALGACVTHGATEEEWGAGQTRAATGLSPFKGHASLPCPRGPRRPRRQGDEEPTPCLA